MKTVSARQANNELSDLLSRAEHGEEIVITKRSKPGRGLRSISSAANDRRAQKGH
jgi:prevent-host-death family protein